MLLGERFAPETLKKKSSRVPLDTNITLVIKLFEEFPDSENPLFRILQQGDTPGVLTSLHKFQRGEGSCDCRKLSFFFDLLMEDMRYYS